MTDAPEPRRRLSRHTRLTITICVTALLLAGAGTALALWLPGNAAQDPAPTESAAPEPKPEPTTSPTPAPTERAPQPVRMIAMGDMLPHDSVNANAVAADGSVSFAPFFAGIQSQLDAADVTFCNQEVPSAGVDFGISGYPTFNTYTEFARDLREGVGCDLVNTATNHTADKGAAGIAATREAWDGLAPAVVAGANRSAEEQRTVPIFEQDGMKIAFVAFAEYSNAPIDGVSLNIMGDTALVTELMTQARANADVVIVSAHWGTEDSHEVNDAQRAFAKQVADLGADVVIGTGPHVLQPVNWVDRADGGRTLVWYSIGNMLNTQLELDQRTGVIAGFELARDEAGTVQVANPTALLTYMHYDWSAEQEAANDLMARNTLSITPLAASDELLQRTRFGVTAMDQVAASIAVLGPDVAVISE
ncbi:CapA family protein [Leucobacter chromiireducens]|uniref:CapA family protein n=1 Tax=Leucobacter chromiireducens subsp. solipictus TaxID=398235 RepID=A0ABS1SJD1_9MICO|nr:CapA family protein [Leucobacter chromiireducens]MBL3680682.1 CapA family protein [Leucobacter chromiireducens subsp. solipictus]